MDDQTCRACGHPIHRTYCPHGGWWEHDTPHPDGHAAHGDTTSVTCRQCGLTTEVANDRATVNRWYEEHRCAPEPTS